jgi:hypothetical protein
MSSLTLGLLSEIVTILAANNSYWVLCGGAQKRIGLSNTELLPLLLKNGPHWNIEVVDQILNVGLKLGTLRQQTTGPDCVTGIMTNGEYFINTNMLFENNANKYFKTIVPGLPAPKLFRQTPFVIY